MVLFRCGAVWMRVEPAARHAARVRDAPAASWRCRPTPCSDPDLDPWTTAPGFPFRPATAKPHTASTTRSSRKVKVSCVLSAATYRWHLTVLRRHSHDLSSEVPRRHCCVVNSWMWITVQSWFPVAVVTSSLTRVLHCPVNITSAAETLFRVYSICCYVHSRSILRFILRVPWVNRILKSLGSSDCIFLLVSLLLHCSIILQWVPSRTLEPLLSSA